MLAISKSDIPKFLESLIKEGFEVIAPVKTKDGTNFEVIEDGDEACLDYVNTSHPPKKFFLPDGETLFTYDLKKFKIKEVVGKKRRVLFGLRPCDLHGLLRLDMVFKKDPYYMQRRKNTIIIAIECSEPGKNCFCESMGTNKVKTGYDLLLSEVKNFYKLESYSKRGKTFLKYFKRYKTLKPKKLKNLRKFDSKNIERRILKIFNHKKWGEIASKCLSCGACNVVCPTCYCFSVSDEVSFEETSGERKRFWSFCMLQEFSRVAGDVIFRRTREERCKQFVFHKLSYFKESYGKHLCVGCGRCIDICPAGIDFFKEVEGML